MRIERFQQVACEAYRQNGRVESAEPHSDGTRRPYGIEIKLKGGSTVRHALTRVPIADEDLAAEESSRVEGELPAVLDEAEPGGMQDQATALFLASTLAQAGNREMSRVYAYGSESRHAGLGVEFHDGSKIHMLLL